MSTTLPGAAERHDPVLWIQCHDSGGDLDGVTQFNAVNFFCIDDGRCPKGQDAGDTQDKE
jgi:hypothetical protein